MVGGCSTHTRAWYEGEVKKGEDGGYPDTGPSSDLICSLSRRTFVVTADEEGGDGGRGCSAVVFPEAADTTVLGRGAHRFLEELGQGSVVGGCEAGARGSLYASRPRTKSSSFRTA